MFMQHSSSFITNFPKGFPWYKKCLSNMTFWISQIPLPWRRNALSKWDIKNLKRNIESGDIILCGNYHEASSVLIPGIMTHTIGYTHHGRCIHAIWSGVSYIWLRRVYRSYDSFILIRPRWKNREQKETFMKFLVSQIWKPYDFFFWNSEKSGYFCTALINSWLSHANYDSWLVSIYPPSNEIDTLFENITLHRALTPDSFMYANFDIIVHSSNITKNNNNYDLKR